MRDITDRVQGRLAATAFALLASAICGGCASTAAGRSYASPGAAVDDLVAALRPYDKERVRAVLGAEGDDLVASGDEVADRTEVEAFLKSYATRHELQVGATEAVLMVGNDSWPMPIPLVQNGAGWRFDTERGKDEILARRIGRNELSTIEVCRAVVDAQAEYAAQDNSGRGAGEYAAKFVSAIGKRDGLFWPAVAGQPDSPLGPLVAEAAKEGYSRSGDPSRRQAYHGYYYRMLTAQGAGAAGGAMSYLADGRLTGGFAVFAEPAVYGVSGVMSFVVARNGIVYQRDLGSDTARVAAAIKAFDPVDGWTIVHE